VDAGGNGVWAIALRCALLCGDHATLYAGAGIVAGSDPAEELDETDRKFRAFLDALRWG
jgi:isochorismate synthase EntC